MNDKTLAYTLLRLFMGLNMFMHGAIRFGPNYGKFIAWTERVAVEVVLDDFGYGSGSRSQAGCSA